MATVGNLVVNLGMNSASFERGSKKARKGLNGIDKGSKNAATGVFGLGKAFTAAAASAAAFVGVFKAIDFAGSLLQAASDAEEVGSKFDAVFKQETQAAEEFSRAFASSVGRAFVDVQNAMATFQDTFVPLGFAREEARKLSEQVVTLAVDLASFNNVADTKAMEDLQSALVGNVETMRKYGVIINQARLNQELLNNGIEGGVTAATEQQKAQARLNIIIRGTADAQGDAIRTAGSYANTIKRLKATFADIKAEVGRVFTQIVVDFAPILKIIVQVAGAILRIFAGVAKVVAKIITTMTPIVELANLFSGSASSQAASTSSVSTSQIAQDSSSRAATLAKERQRQEADLARRADQVFGETRTAQERFNSRRKELRELLKSGTITLDTFNRAIAKAVTGIDTVGKKEDMLQQKRLAAINKAISVAGRGGGVSTGRSITPFESRQFQGAPGFASNTALGQLNKAFQKQIEELRVAKGIERNTAEMSFSLSKMTQFREQSF